MAIELDFQIGVQGAEKLSSVDKIMQQIQGSTKLSAGELRVFEAALKSSGSSSESLKSTLQLVAKGGGDVSVAMSKAAKDVLAFAAAENQVASAATQASTAHSQLASSVSQMGAAHARAVPEIAAASAAIRTFEGAIPIRAIERFSVNILGLGPLLQAAFPLVGLYAFGEMIYRTWERMDPLIKAEESLAKVTKALDADYAQLGRRLESLQIQEITDKFGRVAGSKMAAFYAESDLENDKARIRELGRQIDLTKLKLASGGFASAMPGALGMLLTQRSEMAATKNIEGLTREQTYLTAKTPVDKQQISKDLSDAKKAQDAEDASARRALNSSLRAAESAAAKAAREERERIKMGESLRGDRQDPNVRLFEQYQDDLRNPINRTDEQKFKLGRDFQVGSNRIAKDQRDERLQKAESLSERASDTAESGRLLAEKIQIRMYKEAESYISGAADENGMRHGGSIFHSTNGDPILPKMLGGIDPQQRLRDINSGERVDTRRATLMSQMSGPGNEIALAKEVSEIQFRAQEKRFVQERSLALMRHDTETQLADLESSNASKLYEIRAAYEDKLIEKKKTDQANFRSAVQGGFGALISGGGGGFSSFLKSQVVGMGSTIAGNAADMIYPSVQGAIGNKLNLDPNSLPGRLLKGTPFSADPTKDLLANSNKENTAATNANTTAMQSFNAQLATMLSPSGGGGSAGGGGSSLVFDENGNPTNYGGGGGSTAMGLPSGSGGGAAGKVMAALGIGGAAYSGLSGVLSGLGSTGDVRGIATGISTIGGGATTLSNSERIGGAIGTAGVVVGGGFAAYNDFKKGGARGIIGGIGDLAGVAATLDPEPISKIVLASIAAGSQLIKGLFGDPKAERAHQIEKELGNAKYEEPISMNQTRDQNGNYVDSNRYGSLRQSPFSAVPVVQESSQRYRGGVYEQNPGGVVSPYSGGGSTVNVTINAIDSKSVADHAPAIFNGLAAGAAHGHGDGFIAAMNYGQGR